MQPRDKKGRFTKHIHVQKPQLIEVFKDNGFDLISLGKFTLDAFTSFSKVEGGVYVTHEVKI